MAVKYEKLNIIQDARGVVFEPVRGDAIPENRNTHVVFSGPGVIRGNHYHIKGKETVAVMGPALVRARDDGELKDIEIPRGEAYCFIFPPGQAHAIKNTGKDTNILIAFNTVEHDPENPDTERDVLIEA